MWTFVRNLWSPELLGGMIAVGWAHAESTKPAMKSWIGIAVMIGVLLVPAAALAHPKLVKAQPAQGATLKKSPTKVQLWFHEELDTKLSSLTVLDQKNERVDRGDAKVNLDDRKMMEGSVKPLPSGVYTVRWKAAADDDKVVVEGSVTFRVRE